MYNITLSKAPAFNSKGYFKTWNVKLNGTTVGYLFTDLENGYSVTTVWNEPVTQSSTIRAAFRKAVHYFGGVK